MAFEERGGRLYYYRSRRASDGRVVKEYVGVGLAAELAADADEAARRRERLRREAEKAERERLDALEKPTEDLCEAVEVLASAALLAAGYHRHKRGEWRKRRE